MSIEQPPKSRRRWFPRIGISTFLWLMLLVGILLAWQLDRWSLIAEYEARNRPTGSWAPSEATGPPDTLRAGDIQTAWASLTPDGQREWLELRYDKAVMASAIEVHETYNPGALYQIGVFDQYGQEHIVWKGKDPTQPPSAMGISKVNIAPKFATNRVKIYLDSPKVGGWNEIDAVGLIDSKGKTQWAASARASSTFASGYYPIMSFGMTQPQVIIQPEPEDNLIIIE